MSFKKYFMIRKQRCVNFFQTFIKKQENKFYIFFSLQDNLNLTEEKKKPLRQKGMEEKKAMLRMQLNADKVQNIREMQIFMIQVECRFGNSSFFFYLTD